MNRWFFGIVLLWCLSFSSMHDASLGTFAINMDEMPWTIEIELDQIDLARALKQEVPQIANIVAYIQDNTSWIANGQAASLDLCSVYLDGHHCIVQGTIQLPVEEVSTFKFYNTCLYEVEPDQSNVIYLDQGENSRGFRLHQGRKSTTVHL